MRNLYVGKVTKNCSFTPNSFCARREKLEEGADLPPPPPGAHRVKVSWYLEYQQT